MHKKLNILFLGTPDFAAASLEALIQHEFNIVAVVTAPDKPAGRGLNLQSSPVKKTATFHNLPVLQPIKLKDEAFLDSLKQLDIDLGIIVAFRMIPESIWSLPKLGTFNLHASLLPQYRGAAPIHWAIINGEKETGLTTFFLKHEIDTGDILLQEKTAIGEQDTTGILYEKMMTQGASLVVKTAAIITNGNYKSTAQGEQDLLKKAPKIYKEMAEINFDQPIEQVYNFIRGMNPFPGAWFIYNGKKYALTACRMDHEMNINPPGTAISDGKSNINIACKNGAIQIIKLKPEGKREMTAKEFLNGSKL